MIQNDPAVDFFRLHGLQEQVPHTLKGGDQPDDLFFGIVHPDAQAHTGLNPQPGMQQLGAVMSRPDSDPAFIEHLGRIMGMNAIKVERDNGFKVLGLQFLFYCL